MSGSSSESSLGSPCFSPTEQGMFDRGVEDPEFDVDDRVR